MQQIQVTPEMVADAAASCDATAAEIDADLASLKQFVIGLQGIWHGVAAGTFNTLMIDFDTYGRMMHEALTGIANGLRGHYVNYTDSEIANINSLQQVNGSIPGLGAIPDVGSLPNAKL